MLELASCGFGGARRFYVFEDEQEAHNEQYETVASFATKFVCRHGEQDPDKARFRSGSP
jgi:hypothetical protein